jgi:hypothetical protein
MPFPGANSHATPMVTRLFITPLLHIVNKFCTKRSYVLQGFRSPFYPYGSAWRPPRGTSSGGRPDLAADLLLPFRTLLEAQVFDAAAVAAHQLQGFDADLDVSLDEL